jgi:hypothetical protein
VATLGLSAAPVAAQNYAPPPGAVMDLNGKPLPVASDPLYTSAPFTGSDGENAVTFVFRDDYAFIDFSNVVLIDLTTGSTTNLLVNGDFSGGTHTSNGNLETPTGWTYINPNPVTSDVFVAGNFSNSCVGGGKCWADGTAQGYDELSQSVLMNSQDSYQISFDATATAALLTSNSIWSSVSSNGDGTDFAGNGVDILAYIGSVGAFTAPPPPAPVPELSTWAMMLLGFAGLGFTGYRKANGAALTA